MGCYIIASIIRKNGKGMEVAGYKVLNSQTGQYKLLSERTIQNNNIKLENAKFEFGVLKGTQCSLKRYTRLSEETGRVIGENHGVILGKNTDGEILYVMYPEAEEGLIHRLPPKELKEFCLREYLHNGNNSPIANASVRWLKEANRMQDVDKVITITPIRVNKSGNITDIIEQCPKFTEKEFKFGNRNGNAVSDWKVRIIRKGEKYGRDYCLTNEDDRPLVEFYDMTSDKSSFPIGQSVSRYFLDSLLEGTGGLNLLGYVPAWQINGECFNEIREWLKTIK